MTEQMSCVNSSIGAGKGATAYLIITYKLITCFVGELGLQIPLWD